MIDVKIKHGNQIIKTNHAEKFSELSAEQFISVAPYLSQEVIQHNERIAIIINMLSLTDKQKNDLKFMPGYLVDELMKHHKFLFEDKPFSEWLIKEIEHNGIKYYGPDNNFRNVTWDEFVYCDTYLSSYCDTEADEMLDKIIAVLYRVKRSDYDPLSSEFKGDIREDFNENNISYRARNLEEFDEVTKKAILFNLRSLRNSLQLTYDSIFPYQEKEKNGQYKRKKKKSNAHWGHITRRLCDFADIDRIGKMPMHNVLFELNERLKENKT